MSAELDREAGPHRLGSWLHPASTSPSWLVVHRQAFWLGAFLTFGAGAMTGFAAAAALLLR